MKKKQVHSPLLMTLFIGVVVFEIIAAKYAADDWILNIGVVLASTILAYSLDDIADFIRRLLN